MEFIWESAMEYERRTNWQMRSIANNPSKLEHYRNVAFGCLDLKQFNRREAHLLLRSTTGFDTSVCSWLLKIALGGPL